MSNKISTYVLAEMAAAHEGDPVIGKTIIEGAAKAEADGILFQIIDLDSYIIPSDEDYPEIKICYLNQKEWAALIDRADSLALDVWANVYDLASVRFCKDKKVKGYKLHSANLENEDLICEVAKTKREIALSVGGMEKDEIDAVLNLIYSVDEKAKLHLMYGLQNFPTNPEGINANFIKGLSEEFNIPFGYQDHSDPTSAASTFMPVLFIAEGASVIEKHITHDRSLKGEDYEAALNPDEFAEFVRKIRIIDGILNKKPHEVSTDELIYRQYKSLMKVIARKNIRAGDIFSEDNITIMRARKGEVDGKRIKSLLGKKASSAYEKLEPIRRSELVKIGIFITARLKSKRLPLKVIKSIMGRPMVKWMIDRLKRCNIDPLVMMTSINPQDDPLVEIAEKNGIPYFRGSEDDVLVRIRDCARQFDVDLIISATADDPLKEPVLIEQMIRRYLDEGYDFCEMEGAPNGCECYALKSTAVEKACEMKASSDTEIWGPYFREAGVFKCDVIKVTDPRIQRPQYRVTVDTQEDFNLVTWIFNTLLKKRKEFDIYDICQLLDENPEMVAINANVRQRPSPKAKLKKKSEGNRA
ncbi:N-acetylneuraminate synthase family protein [Chloroflexota bacterium]